MSELVRESAREPIIRETALDLTRTVYATCYDDFVFALRTFFLRHFRFIDEPDEMITPPARLLRAIKESGSAWGDCDDGAILAAAFFYSLGFSVRFRAILEAADGSFEHVFAEYRAPGSEVWRIFDPTVNFTPRFESSLVAEI